MSLLAGAMQGLGKGLEKYGDVKTEQYLEQQKMAALEEMKINGENRANTRADQVYDKQRKDSLADDQRKLKEGIAVDSYKRQQDSNSPEAKAKVSQFEAQTELLNKQVDLLNKGFGKDGKPIGGNDLTATQKAAKEKIDFMLDTQTVTDEYGNKLIQPFTGQKLQEFNALMNVLMPSLTGVGEATPSNDKVAERVKAYQSKFNLPNVAPKADKPVQENGNPSTVSGYSMNPDDYAPKPKAGIIQQAMTEEEKQKYANLMLNR